MTTVKAPTTAVSNPSSASAKIRKAEIPQQNQASQNNTVKTDSVEVSENNTGRWERIGNLKHSAGLLPTVIGVATDEEFQGDIVETAKNFNPRIASAGIGPAVAVATVQTAMEDNEPAESDAKTQADNTPESHKELTPPGDMGPKSTTEEIIGVSEESEDYTAGPFPPGDMGPPQAETVTVEEYTPPEAGSEGMFANPNTM